MEGQGTTAQATARSKHVVRRAFASQSLSWALIILMTFAILLRGGTVRYFKQQTSMKHKKTLTSKIRIFSLFEFTGKGGVTAVFPGKGSWAVVTCIQRHKEQHIKEN